MIRIAVFISGSGTNLQSIIDNCENKNIDGQIALVLTNEKAAYGIERAKKHGIPHCIVDHRDFSSREDFEKAILDAVTRHGPIDLICLAGFMRVLTPYFLKNAPCKIINIHPALLPSFPGTHGQQDAFEYGEKFSGCTVHFVDEGVDTGPIIIQAVVPIFSDDTIETLKARILAQEHKIYPQAIRYFAEGRIEIYGRKVFIKDEKKIDEFSHINPRPEAFE